MSTRDDVRTFEEARPVLLGLAYRILGSRADAEDAVQDTFIKWERTDTGEIDNPIAWLTTACTRRCIDLLRSAHRTRVEYVGAWLPEPIQTPVEAEDESRLTLGSSLSTAFMLMLERLTPKERAAYLLHEIFDVSYPEIARTLDIQETTCRKLVSRARANIDQAKVRHVTPVDRQEQLLAAFETAVSSGSTAPLMELLSDDIELCADSGGKVQRHRPDPARQGGGSRFRGPLAARLLAGRTSGAVSTINGGRGLIVEHDGERTATVSFAYDEAGRVTNIYIMRNPDKLARLDGRVID